MHTVFSFLARCPLTLLHAVGVLLGWAAYLLSPAYRGRLNRHARQAGLSLAQRLRAVGQAGRMVAEVPRLWGRPHDQPLGPSVQWRQPEALDAAVAEGRGVILLTPHLGCFEVTAQAYAERHGGTHPVTALYRPAKKAWLAQWMATARNRPGMLTSPATLAGVRQLLRALKQGHTIGILPDQVPPEGMGEWVPFFGQQAYTMTMAAKLVAQTGCAVVLLRGERLSWRQRRRLGCDFVVHASRLTAAQESVLKEGNTSKSCRLMNEAMESMILQAPEQYLWGYNRFKNPRPDILKTPE